MKISIIVLSALLIGTQVQAQTQVNLDDLTTGSMTAESPSFIAITGVTTAIIKTGCSYEDLRKLLYQARQYIPQEDITLTSTSNLLYEDGATRLRRMADELDRKGEFLKRVGEALDHDHCY